MAILNKLRKLFTLNKKTIHLFIEAFLYLGLARCLISLPFARIAPSLGARMEETSHALPEGNKAELARVHEAIQVVSGHTFWESKCLVRAIAASKMLNRRGIESTIYLGTARNEFGHMAAHAWLRSGPYYITGYEGMEDFTVVGKFAKFIRNEGQ